MEDKKIMTHHAGNVAYFAGGCFWAPERFFRFIKGVTKFELGYADCEVEHFDCQKVIHGEKDFLETVKVIFDPHKIGYGHLLDLFLRTIDHPTENLEKDDVWTHGHTGIFYTSEDQLPIINMVLEEVAKRYDELLAVEALPLGNFYNVEDYNKKYRNKHQEGYCSQHSIIQAL